MFDASAGRTVPFSFQSFSFERRALVLEAEFRDAGHRFLVDPSGGGAAGFFLRIHVGDDRIAPGVHEFQGPLEAFEFALDAIEDFFRNPDGVFGKFPFPLFSPFPFFGFASSYFRSLFGLGSPAFFPFGVFAVCAFLDFPFGDFLGSWVWFEFPSFERIVFFF